MMTSESCSWRNTTTQKLPRVRRQSASSLPEGGQPRTVAATIGDPETPVAGIAQLRDLRQMTQGALARQARKQRAYLVARSLTQVGILGMALAAIGPVLTHTSQHAPSGAHSGPMGLQGLILLGCLTAAGLVLTNWLRNRWEADGGLPG